MWLLSKKERRYKRELHHQVVPKEFAHTTWRLLKTSDGHVGESCMKITFNDKAELLLKFKSLELHGEYLFKGGSQLALSTGRKSL